MENNSTENTEETEEKPQLKDSESLWAYTLMSWLLATFPAIMIVPNVYSGGTIEETATRNVHIIVISMCSFSGAFIGLVIGALMILVRRKDQILPLIIVPFFGIIWGIVVGAVGGFPLFFIGGIIAGWMVAVPLGFIGFALFGIIYESLADRRLLWWHILLIEIGVLSVLLSAMYNWSRINYPDPDKVFTSEDSGKR